MTHTLMANVRCAGSRNMFRIRDKVDGARVAAETPSSARAATNSHSCSAAIMLFVQFWHGFGEGGGMYMAWYLPLLLMTVFRPNLEDRVALSVLGEGWFQRRRARLAQLGRAA